MVSKRLVCGRQSRVRCAVMACFAVAAAAALLVLLSPRPQLLRDASATIPVHDAQMTAESNAGSLQKSHILASYGSLPVSFEPNQGQTDPQVKYLARGHGYTLFLTSSGAVLSLPITPADSQRSNYQARKVSAAKPQSPVSNRSAAALRMQLVGSTRQPQIVGEQPLPGKTNYFIGNDPKKWRTNVPQFSRVSYHEVYPGVDLAFHGAASQLEFDFLVNPGARPEAIALKFSGARELRTNESGELVLASAAGDVRLHKPVAYQEIHGVRQPVEARFELKGRDEVAFAVGDYDRGRRLVIDPTLAYSTYLGGTATDEAIGVAVDSTGNAYVTGETNSINFPATSGIVQAANKGGFDAFVAKINTAASGPASLVYSTYLGGSGNDSGNAIAVDATGNVYVTGGTFSTDFPHTTGVLQMMFSGTEDAFVTKLNSSGTQLLYSTFLGGGTPVTASTVGAGIAIDSSGNAYVAGETSATAGFPTTNAVQPSNGGLADAFVTVLNSSATAAIYSTFLGGSKDDLATGIAIDPQNKIYVTGVTSSSALFPATPGAFKAYGGNQDALIAKIDPTRSGNASLIYFTYLGGSGQDNGHGIAVDSTGAAYVTGLTQSTNFPTQNALQNSLKSAAPVPQNAFVTKLNPTGTAPVVYSTYLGGTGSDSGLGIALDDSNNAYITGATSSLDFPTQNPTQGTNGGLGDAFVTELSAAGNSLLFSTFLGGSQAEDSNSLAGIAVDTSNNIYVVGDTASNNFPVTSSAFQSTFQTGGSDAFLSKFTANTDFSITASAPTPNPVAKGSSATATITLTSLNGFNSAVALACASQTAGVTCSPSPASVTPTSTGVTSTLTISVSSTASLTAPSLRRDSRPLYALWLPIPGLALVGVGLASERSRRKKLLGLLLGTLLFLGFVFQVACSSSSSSGGGGGGTPYTVTVTGTEQPGGAPSHNVTVSGSFK